MDKSTDKILLISSRKVFVVILLCLCFLSTEIVSLIYTAQDTAMEMVDLPLEDQNEEETTDNEWDKDKQKKSFSNTKSKLASVFHLNNTFKDNNLKERIVRQKIVPPPEQV